MKIARVLLFTLFCWWSSTQAQHMIPIPDTLAGQDIYLSIAESNHAFYQGFRTTTIAYNGSDLDPTVILNKGQNVNMHVTNLLADTTTTHWHGLHGPELERRENGDLYNFDNVSTCPTIGVFCGYNEKIGRL